MFNLIILKVAFRNIFLYRMKTIIVGSILIFGAFIAILGNSFVDAISGGMKNSITQSVTGDLQIYSKNAKEKLSVFGNMDGSPSDIGFVKDFKLIQESLSKIDNIKAIIPLGNNFAMMNPGNLIDIEVEKLRSLFKKNQTVKLPNKENEKEIHNSKTQLKFLIQDLYDNQKNRKDDFLNLKEEDLKKNKEYLVQALNPDFWTDFDSNFNNRLEFLANKIAPLLVDENMLYFSYLGTNPDLFSKNFQQFEIVKGEMIPEGKKGFLIHDFIYESFVKHRIARRLDSIKKELIEKKIKIASSKDLQDKVKANLEQLAEIYLQLNPSQTEKIKTQIKIELKSTEENFKALLSDFFKLDDSNFLSRYDFFYKEIAPELSLYKIKIGDKIPLTAFTKLGSSAATNVKVYGTFRFKSFENSPLAGNFSLIDMVSFRQLYGFITEERKKQNDEMAQEMGVDDLSKEDLENMMGGGPSTITQANSRKDPQTPKKAATAADSSASATSAAAATSAASDSSIEKKAEQNVEQNKDSFSVQELETGVFLNAAIFLKDPLKTRETISAINNISDKENLEIQAVDWQEASGVIGQMTFALKFLLYFFVSILLTIASLMIMNSLLMATMDRQQEIGTMRAIGAPKSFVYKVFLYETFLTSLLFGGIGTLLALLIINTIGKVGIPAQGDVALFFFSGPRLYLAVQWFDVFIVFVMMSLISSLASQYPSWRAMRISPIMAIQKKD